MLRVKYNFIWTFNSGGKSKSSSCNVLWSKVITLLYHKYATFIILCFLHVLSLLKTVIIFSETDAAIQLIFWEEGKQVTLSTQQH